MWDERYADPDEYAYGTQPNTFFASEAWRIPDGPVLFLAEGEGRNAVWLAERGHAVTAVDGSAVGLEKARRLAAERGVEIETVHADLASHPIEPGAWAGIVSIFGHLPPDIRREVHRRAASGLRPGGLFLLEAYTPRQLAYGTGGPPTAEMMMDLAGLRAELPGLELLVGQEIERWVEEGRYHSGLAHVVQVVAQAP
ncbi:cyclopropane-fatty-acyl-phospholipid synthase family protein [Halorhodospira sp. 9622]|uniref:SAM-dependent methyltransferase n=1 Tax=Halorhodospira sp. 9622 TaxID=2899136 RepID=UPI001EE85E39|nr:class I SAM-dependent methyltransferase [Halorhodospira sp. 9622]MCG5538882.1 class I SAM-dependent methyltransferase [Halorhodospira sp. 9622]